MASDALLAELHRKRLVSLRDNSLLPVPLLVRVSTLALVVLVSPWDNSPTVLMSLWDNSTPVINRHLRCLKELFHRLRRHIAMVKCQQAVTRT